MKNDEVAPEHLVLSILKHKENKASKILFKFDIDYKTYKNELVYMLSEDQYGGEIFILLLQVIQICQWKKKVECSGRYQRKGGSKSKTPVLDNFGSDITQVGQ